MKKVLLIVIAALMILTSAAFADPIEIVYWSVRSGESAEYLQRRVDEFNASQDKYFVNLTYTGGYFDTLAKFQTTTTGNRPDLVDMAAEVTGIFIDNPDMYIPVQKFIEEDQYDISDIMPNLVIALSDADGNLMGIPIGNSQAGVFYNTKLLREAGVDPDTDLNSLEEIGIAARKLKDIGVKYPFYADDDSATFYAYAIPQGFDLVNNNNGMDALCTKSLIGEEPLLSTTKKFFTMLHDWQAEGLLAPLGQSGNDYRTMLVNGDLGIFLWTIACYTDIGDMSNWELEFGFQPAGTIEAGAEYHGQIAQGGNLFIGNNDDPERARGAWEMMKYVLDTNFTVEFAMMTGYLPTTISGYESETYQTFLTEKAPSLVKSHEAQMNTEPGCSLPWMPMFGDFDVLARDIIIEVIENPDYDPEQAAIDFADQTDECIEMYNMSKK